MFAWMLSLLAALGFALAALGLYGLIAQTTIERRREFGIRLALGAAGGDIVRLVARHAVIVSSFGVRDRTVPVVLRHQGDPEHVVWRVADSIRPYTSRRLPR